MNATFTWSNHSGSSEGVARFTLGDGTLLKIKLESFRDAKNISDMLDRQYQAGKRDSLIESIKECLRGKS